MTKEELDQYVIMETETAVDALQKIDKNAKGIVFVLNEKEQVVGTLTDGDIRRWLIKTADLHGTIQGIMNRNPKILYKKNKAEAKEHLEKYSITALPIVNSQEKIVDIIFKSFGNTREDRIDRMTLVDTPVVIMAGGKGTRLYPYTKILPKPLIPIGDIPIMERIINRFNEYGVHDFYATLNYRKSMIKSYFAEINGGYSIHYVEENQPLGTGGSLRLIEEKFEKPIIVTNCDILIDGDYADIYKYHMSAQNDMTIVSALKNIVVPYGVIQSKENGTIISMEEKPKLSYFVNTGMYIINPEVMNKIPENTFYHMTDLAEQLLKDGKRVGMYPISEDSFLDMGEFEEMHRMEKKLNLQAD